MRFVLIVDVTRSDGSASLTEGMREHLREQMRDAAENLQLDIEPYEFENAPHRDPVDFDVVAVLEE